jgi:hypothetical protein
MLKFITFQNNGEVISINPNYVAHIYESGHNAKYVVITMCDGRRYEIEYDYSKNVTCLMLTQKFEVQANYGGI